MLTKEKKSDRLIRTSLDRSRYSLITWNVETRSRLLEQIEAFDWPKVLRRVEISRSKETIHIDLHSDRFFRPVNCEDRKHCSLEREKPASLIIGIHPNGTVSFHAFGCSTSYSSVDSDGFFLTLLDCSQDLAGKSGEQRIRRALSLFSKLSAISLTENAPTKASGRFITKLESRSSKFKFLYATSADARRVKASQYMGFAGGLAGGLISSSVFPLLVTTGESLRNQGRFVPVFFQPEYVLLMSLCVAVAALYVIAKSINQR